MSNLAAKLAAGVGLAALGGFLTSLLRRRPATSYAASLRQPIAVADSSAETSG